MDVQYSTRDKKRGIQIPNSLTPELAELIGILAGDGNIYLKKNKKYEIRICGHLSEDKEHHQIIIASLFNKVFNVKNLVETTHQYKRARYIGISSKAITTFLVYHIGLPSGKKLDAKQIIPLAILRADITIKAAFLRGLADTDFCLRFKRRKDIKNPYHSDPYIVGRFGNNQKMINDLLYLINSLGIRAYITEERGEYKINRVVTASGKKNLQKWMATICFNNYKHTTKYDIWDLYGFCPPHTTLAQRYEILDGDIRLLQDYARKMEKHI